MRYGYSIQAGFTRPANTTQYTAKDVVGNALALPMEFKFEESHLGQPFWIMAPVLTSSNPATTSGSFKLLLFRVPPTTPIDHAVFAPSIDQLGYLLGVVDFSVAVKISNATIYLPDGFVPLWAMCFSEDQKLYGVLLDDAAYTPASGEQFRVVLRGQWEK